MDIVMNYVIFGAGGTGLAIAAYLAKNSNKTENPVLIARGENLQKIRESGLQIIHLWDQTTETIPVYACAEDAYNGKPDVIFVCVKGYSLDSVLPFIRKNASSETVIIPILNIFGTGSKLQRELPDDYILDGCIYVSASREAPGQLQQHGPIMRIVYGPRQGQEDRPVLAKIEKELKGSGIVPIYSHHIERDCLEKFSYVSPIGAAGIYLNAVAGDFQKEGEARELFISMIREISALADAMGFPFEKDYTEVNLKILSGLPAGTNTSMQRDVAAGHPSEVDGLVYQVLELADKYGVPIPKYRMVAEELLRRGLR